MSVRDSLTGNQLDSESFEALLLHFEAGWTEKTMAAECARVLKAEKKRRFYKPELLSFAEIDCLPLTKRIDGMIPLWVPIARNVSVLADEFLEEAFRFELPLPGNEELEELRRDLTLCYFAFFHGRRVRIDLGMRMELALGCPESPSAGARSQPLLLGRLPFGGRCTVLTTQLPAHDLAVLPGGDLEHCPRLAARRDDGGRLQLHRAEAPYVLSRVP